MTKALPPGSPELYYRLAETSYMVKSEARNYLDKKFGSGVIRVLEQADPSTILGGSWKMTLFEDTRSGELCIGFEGTNSVRNVLGDFFHHLADPKGLLKDMGNIADNWVKKYKKNIWSFVGHSEGGFFATHVKKSWDTFRVTLNAHKAERGPKNINLRLHRDIVSDVASVKDRYITLDGGEGHFLKSFKKPLCGKEWCDLDAKRFSPQALL